MFLRVAFSGIFLAILLSPAAVFVSRYDPDVRVDRLGLEPPRFSMHALLDKDYYRAFEQYYDDSLSLRGPLVVAKNWLDYHLFHRSDSRKVYVGADGWLYAPKSIEDYRKGACGKARLVHRLALELYAAEKVVEASGRRFLFAIAPNKASIYPEYVGSLRKDSACGKSMYSLFLDEMTTHPLTGFVDLEGALLEKRRNQAVLYDKTGAYWNSLGAEVAAQAIFKKIFGDQWEGRVKARPGFKADGFGDLATVMMGISREHESKPMIRIAGDEASSLGWGLLYGDGFIWNLLPYMVDKFEHIDAIETDRIPSRRYGEFPGSYEFIAVIKDESDIENVHLDLDRIFTEFDTETTASCSKQLDLRTVVPVSHISLGMRDSGLEIKSIGAESIFLLPSVPGSDDVVFRFLGMTLESKTTDMMTIEYGTIEPFVLEKHVKPGCNRLYLPLPVCETFPIRIKPGKSAGLFMMRSVEVIDLSKDRRVVDGAGNAGPETVPDDAHTAFVLEESGVGIRVPDTRTGLMGEMRNAPAETGSPEPSGNAVEENTVLEEDSAVSSGQEDKAGLLIEDLGLDVPVSARYQDAAAAPRSDPPRDTVFDVLMPLSKETDLIENPSVMVRDYENWRIFQRRGTSADIVVSGTYTGRPVSVEARVVRQGPSGQVVPWTVVDKFPENGIFLGTLRGVPQGGWYGLQVRFSNDHEISSMGSANWGVGMLVACIGQSNMKEWFYTGTGFEGQPLLCKRAGNKWLRFGRIGNAAVAFGGKLIERLGVPIGMLDYSENGTGLRKEADWGKGYWEDTSPGSVYERFISGVSAVGGSVEFVVWVQGEADAARGTVTEAEYGRSLKSFVVNQVRIDVTNGSMRENLPFLIVSMIKRPGGKDKPHQAIRNAQEYVANSVPNCYLAATTLDLKNHGRQHLHPDAYTTLGLRVAQTVLYILGEEAYYRGPCMTDVLQVDGRTFDVKIRHRGGSDFTPLSKITGWEVLSDNKAVAIENVYHQDPKTIRIKLEEPVGGTAFLRYLYGANPNTANPVRDNSAMKLPLEAFSSAAHLDKERFLPDRVEFE